MVQTTNAVHTDQLPAVPPDQLSPRFPAIRLQAALERLTPVAREQRERDYVAHLVQQNGFEARRRLGWYRKSGLNSRMVESRFRAFARQRLVGEIDETEFAAYVAQRADDRGQSPAPCGTQQERKVMNRQSDEGSRVVDRDGGSLNSPGLFPRVLRAVGMGLALLLGVALISAGGTATLNAREALPDTSTTGPSSPNQIAVPVGVALLLLGVAGGSVAIVVGQRRRMRTAVDVFQMQIETLQDRQLALETDLSRQRDQAEILRDSEQRLRALLQQLPAGVFLTDAQGEVRYVNDRWQLLAGLTAEQAAGSGWIQALYPDDRDPVLRLWRDVIRNHGEFAAEHRFRTPSGRVKWLNTRATPLLDRTGRVTGYLGVNADIADLKQTEETLRASEARFRSYFELPLIGIALTGADKRWWEVNDRLCEMLGYQRAQLLSMSWAELTHPDDLAMDVMQFERVLGRRIEGYSLDKRFIRQDGALLYTAVSTRCVRRANGAVDYFVMVVQDITERKEAEERAHNLAHYDPLTGLPNRALLGDRLLQAVARAGRQHAQVGVMLVDIDRFKLINDALGHRAGDRLLQQVAGCLQQCIRQCDTLSRQGGDEFAVLLPDLDSGDEATRIAQRMLDLTMQPMRLDDQELNVTCSIGISLYPRDGRTADQLLKNADIALYRAKDMGRNNYQFYLSGATMLSRERLNLETSLRHAVERQQLEVYYQPKWDFQAQAVTGAEALVRWNHPRLGLLSPARFIPIAEDSGLVLPMGEWVLRSAIREIGDLQRNGFPGLRIAVNLSGRQFQQAELAELVSQALAESGFDPVCLELELTESTLMRQTESNLAVLHALKATGARIAIDDFGTGYSSLSYLQRFPVDVLKIDRSFVMDLPGAAGSVAIVDAIVTLAHGLGLEVVAEGVETPEQLTFLHTHGCDEGQGYYFGRPTSLVEFRALLDRQAGSSGAKRTEPAML